MTLGNLGYALQVRYQQSARNEDLREAIESYQQALARVPQADPLHWRLLGNLAGALHVRSELTGEARDLDRAIDAYGAFVQRLSSASPDAPVARSNLALGVQSRYEQRHAPVDLERAVELYRASCAAGVQSRGVFLGFARRWGMWAFERRAWTESIEAFDRSLECLHELVRAQLLRGHKESWLRDGIGLSGEAALAAVHDGDKDLAAVWLERARAVLFSEALYEDLADLQRLRESGRQHLLSGTAQRPIR